MSTRFFTFNIRGLILASLVSPIILIWSSPILAEAGETVEIGVEGMTCPFCVHGVQTNLHKLPHVSGVQVSLELKKVRVHMKPGHKADIDKVVQAIKDAGFKPGSHTVVKTND